MILYILLRSNQRGFVMLTSLLDSNTCYLLVRHAHCTGLVNPYFAFLGYNTYYWYDMVTGVPNAYFVKVNT